MDKTNRIIEKDLLILEASKDCIPSPQLHNVKIEAEKEIYDMYGLDKYFKLLHNKKIN